jgi:hypothetical protein
VFRVCICCHLRGYSEVPALLSRKACGRKKQEDTERWEGNSTQGIGLLLGTYVNTENSTEFGGGDGDAGQ